MPGERLLLDTNILVAALAGEIGLVERVARAEWVGTSIVCVLEFLAFPRLDTDDRALFLSLVGRLQVVDLTWNNAPLLEAVEAVRSQRQIKLPDAIVAASAWVNGATLVSRDSALIKACETMGWSAQALPNAR
jgi:tRNA(fMet)-specific endonuclease VapC